MSMEGRKLKMACANLRTTSRKRVLTISLLLLITILLVFARFPTSRAVSYTSYNAGSVMSAESGFEDGTIQITATSIRIDVDDEDDLEDVEGFEFRIYGKEKAETLDDLSPDYDDDYDAIEVAEAPDDADDTYIFVNLGEEDEFESGEIQYIFDQEEGFLRVNIVDATVDPTEFDLDVPSESDYDDLEDDEVYYIPTALHVLGQGVTLDSSDPDVPHDFFCALFTRAHFSPGEGPFWIVALRVADMITYLAGALGTISIIFFSYKYMTPWKDKDDKKKTKEDAVRIAIGLIIIFSARTIAEVISWVGGV